MVSCYTTLIPSLGLHTGPACEAALSTDMQRSMCPIGKRKERNIQYLGYLFTRPDGVSATLVMVGFVLHRK